jgi:hypothetical protein
VSEILYFLPFFISIIVRVLSAHKMFVYSLLCLICSIAASTMAMVSAVGIVAVYVGK